MIFLFTGLGLI